MATMHVWAKLKEHIYRLNPNTDHIIGSGEELKNAFDELIQQAWCSLGQEDFNGLIKSMESTIKVVLLAKGWYTKYYRLFPVM